MVKFEDLVKYFGNQNKLSIKLNVSRQAVTQWKNAGFVPPAQAIEIERITQGMFKAVDLVVVK